MSAMCLTEFMEARGAEKTPPTLRSAAMRIAENLGMVSVGRLSFAEDDKWD